MNGTATGKSFSLSAGKDFTANAAIQTNGSFVAAAKNAYINSTSTPTPPP